MYFLSVAFVLSLLQNIFIKIDIICNGYYLMLIPVAF